MNELSHIHYRIQGALFPFFEEIAGVLTDRMKQLIAILELAGIESLIPPAERHLPGRPATDHRILARAFIAKAVFGIPTTRALIERLKDSHVLRTICGFERAGDVPSEAVFSRTFGAFADSRLPSLAHSALVERFLGEKLVGHVSRDSTAIEAREKPVRKTKKKKSDAKKRGRGRPRKGEEPPPKPPTRLERQADGMPVSEMIDELPGECDRGCKKNSRGSRMYWVGYKLHVDWTDGQVPVSCILTSASLHDSQVAIPLAEVTAGRVTSLYDLMDAAYDAKEIRGHSEKLGHVPIIDSNPRNGEKTETDPATAVRYRERSSAERGFGRLKDEFGGRTVRVRGHAKVMAHLMFGMIALAADQLLKMLC